MKQGKINPHLNFLSNTLLVIGLISILTFGYLLYQRYNPQNLAFNITEVSATSENRSSNTQPVGVRITSINLVLPITPAEIKENKWQASSNSISHLKTSPIPGEKGNSILYGHNWPNLLGSLKNVNPGEKITIIYSDNSSEDFEIEYKTKVSPSEISILNNSEDSRITLYTCAGFLDTERLVVVARRLVS